MMCKVTRQLRVFVSYYFGIITFHRACIFRLEFTKQRPFKSIAAGYIAQHVGHEQEALSLLFPLIAEPPLNVVAGDQQRSHVARDGRRPKGGVKLLREHALHPTTPGSIGTRTPPGACCTGSSRPRPAGNGGINPSQGICQY